MCVMKLRFTIAHLLVIFFDVAIVLWIFSPLLPKTVTEQNLIDLWSGLTIGFQFKNEFGKGHWFDIGKHVGAAIAIICIYALLIFNAWFFLIRDSKRKDSK